MKPFNLIILGFLLGLIITVSAGASQQNELISQGTSLYAEHCAKCHRTLEKTTKPQRASARLRSSIKIFPAMSNLNFLTDQQLEAIASALAAISLD